METKGKGVTKGKGGEQSKGSRGRRPGGADVSVLDYQRGSWLIPFSNPIHKGISRSDWPTDWLPDLLLTCCLVDLTH